MLSSKIFLYISLYFDLYYQSFVKKEIGEIYEIAKYLYSYIEANKVRDILAE